jgi:hypothetical protein
MRQIVHAKPASANGAPRGALGGIKQFVSPL